VELFDEHLGESTARLDDRAALERFGDCARSNVVAPPPTDSSRVFALDPATYGR
jgi:hypothetical protein